MATQTRVPTSDVAVEWTPSTGSDNYALVDEYPATSDTDYNSTIYPTPKVDKFGFTAFAIPANSAIDSVKVYVRGKSSSSNATHTGTIWVGGTAYSGAATNYSTSFTEVTFTWLSNPKSGVMWSVDDINGIGANALQNLGYSSTGAIPEVTRTVSRIYIEVTYTLRTQRRVPTSDIADYVQWTPSTGTTHYNLVDEYPVTSDADYNQGSAIHSDHLGFAAFTIPEGAGNISVKIYIRGHTLGANDGIQSVLIVDDNDTEYQVTTTNWTADYTEVTFTYTENPKTSSPWTASVINSLLAFGYAHDTADELVTAWVSRVYIEVTWETMLRPFPTFFRP